MEKPNIIIITTDQQRKDTLGCYGSDFIETPHLDRLAAGGVRFNRAYTVNPVCTPARFSLITGQYLSRHGALNVGMSCPETGKTLGDYLGKAGYRTHLIGKAHFQAYACPGKESVEAFNGKMDVKRPPFNGPYYGFQTIEMSMGHASYGQHGHYGQWVRSQLGKRDFDKLNFQSSPCETTFPGEAVDWEWPMELHSSKWIADRTMEFLKKRDKEKPFLLSIGFQDPHHPHCVPREYEGKIDPERVPLPKRKPGELDDKPPHFSLANRGKLKESSFGGAFGGLTGQGGWADIESISEEDIQLSRSYYYTMVKIIDTQMGRIMSALENEGLMENTIIIFTTDHGELLGDHGLWQKGPFHYEDLINIPLIMHWPHKIKEGFVSDSLINLTDIAPTLLAAAGIPIPSEMDGANALPLLEKKEKCIRDYTIVECVDDPEKLRLKTIVTANRKLTYYHGQEFGELYDLEKDPQEFINLWYDPHYIQEKIKLISMILDHMERIEPREHRYAYA
jgi:arylsulfatase A-like enzyme